MLRPTQFAPLSGGTRRPRRVFSGPNSERPEGDIGPHRKVIRSSLGALLLVALLTSPAAAQPKKVTYEDDVLPILRDNCLKCHNPDKLKGDLDLSSFSAAIKGGGGGATLNAGDPDGSTLYKSIIQSEDPTMPPNGKLADKDIAVIKKWIEGGLLQGVNSKALAANKPAVDLALKKVSVAKPEGPPPMPGTLPLDPVVRPLHTTALSAIAHSPWAPVVALTSAKQVVLYNTANLDFIGVLPFPEGLPCDLKFSRNGKLLLAGGGRGGQSGLVTVWDITTGERIITIGDQFDSVTAADLSSDQQWIALGGPDRVLKIYSTKDGALQHRIKKHTEWVTAIEFSPDSKYLATGDRNGGLVLWETETGQEMFSLTGHRGAITAVSWRDDSAMVASASEDGTVKLWKAGDGASLRSITAHPGGALCVRFTHDGRMVSSGRDNKIQAWETSGRSLLSIAAAGELPNRVTFTDDGKRIIGSDWQGKVTVWDAKTGKAAGELEANPPPLTERVQQLTQRLATLKADQNKIAKDQASAELEAKAAQGKLDNLKRTVAENQAQLAAKQAEPTSPATAAAIKIIQGQIAAAQKEVTAATPATTALARKAADAKAKAEETSALLAVTESALAKWKAALANTGGKSAQRKVSLR